MTTQSDVGYHPPTVSSVTPSADPSPSPYDNAKRATSSPSPATPLLREAAAASGGATFAYTSGHVDLVGLWVDRGIEIEAYRLARSYVVVRFIDKSRVSTMYAYWSAAREPIISVCEEVF